MEFRVLSLLRSAVLALVSAALAGVVSVPSHVRAGAGSEDTTVQPPQFNTGIRSIYLDPRTVRAVVGGACSEAYDSTTNRYTYFTGVARLVANGGIDTEFNPAMLGQPKANAFAVNAVAVQSDSDVVVGGNFTFTDATTHQGIVRLLSSGVPDTAYNKNLGTGADSAAAAVSALAIQSNGKILVGGSFTSFNGASAHGLIRLNTDLTRDTGFAPDEPEVLPDAGFVYGMAVVPNGSVVFVNQGNTPYRLTSAGAVDTGFDPSEVVKAAGADSFDTTTGGVAVRSDGKVLAVLDFLTSATGQPDTFAASVVRLNTNGSLDTTFDYQAKIVAKDASEVPIVDAILPPSDGTVVVAGQFATVGGLARATLIWATSTSSTRPTAKAACTCTTSRARRFSTPHRRSLSRTCTTSR